MFTAGVGKSHEIINVDISHFCRTLIITCFEVSVKQQKVLLMGKRMKSTGPSNSPVLQCKSQFQAEVLQLLPVQIFKAQMEKHKQHSSNELGKTKTTNHSTAKVFCSRQLRFFRVIILVDFITFWRKKNEMLDILRLGNQVKRLGVLAFRCHPR